MTINIISGNVKTTHRESITWILISGLLFLRFPLLIWSSMSHQKWAYLTSDIGTYFLIAILIWWERDRLAESNIDGLALGLILLKPINLFFLCGNSYWNIAYIFYIPISIGLLLALFVNRPKASRPDKKSWIWLLVGMLTGMALGIGAGYVFSHFQNPDWPGRKSISEIIANPMLIIQSLVFTILYPIYQLFYAGAMEEPLFRGFLWGALRRMGWRNRWICLFQAGLFCLGHIYYIYSKLYWSFGFAFIAGLVFGILAYRSRSIATSMAAHGFTNGWGDFFAHMLKWLKI